MLIVVLMILDLVSGVLSICWLLKLCCRCLVIWKMLLSLLMFLFMSRIFGLFFIVLCMFVFRVLLSGIVLRVIVFFF